MNMARFDDNNIYPPDGKEFSSSINFDIAYQPLSRYPEKKYVIRTDTDQAIGVVGKNFSAVSHPKFFGTIRETWRDLLPELAEEVCIRNKVSRNGAWALEEVIFPKARQAIETSRHSTEIALRFICWHGLDGSSSNNCLAGAIDFFCTNGMVLGDYNQVKHRNTKNFSLNQFVSQIRNLESNFEAHVNWCRRLASQHTSEYDIKQFLEEIIPAERTRDRMFEAIMAEGQTRGRNMWAMYSAFTEYASHEDRFELRRSANDNVAERLHLRGLNVAKWVAHPAFAQMMAA